MMCDLPRCVSIYLKRLDASDQSTILATLLAKSPSLRVLSLRGRRQFSTLHPPLVAQLNAYLATLTFEPGYQPYLLCEPTICISLGVHGFRHGMSPVYSFTLSWWPHLPALTTLCIWTVLIHYPIFLS